MISIIFKKYTNTKNYMKKSILFMILGLSIFSFACQSKKTDNQETTLPAGVSKIIVKETLNAGGYTYINGTNDIWVAVRQQPIEVGKTYYYERALEMKDFHSKELNRDFPLIYFLNSISDQLSPSENKMSAAHQQNKTIQKLEVSIAPEEGIISIADLYAQKNELAGKAVHVKGKVAKFNQNIMGKNWVHIQDGSEFEGNFDLTITTSDIVAVGQVIEFKGTIALDKDFGAGYSYSLIMEEAEIQSNKN